MKNTIAAAAWVPGLPFVLHPEKSAHWKNLNQAFQTLGTHVADLRPDAIVLYSTQWLSVLGTSFQTHSNPRGIHVDENWHEWGDLEFNFKTDTDLGERFAGSFRELGFPSKTVAFEGFPIDTGTLVALKFLNPKGNIPVSIVSSWVYADAQKSATLGRSMRDTCASLGKKVVFIASSLLSTKYFPQEISPAEDHISSPNEDEWNRKLLNHFEAGDLAAAAQLAPEFVAKAGGDMQLNALHWLSGALEGTSLSGTVHAYEPQWGTGAAVVEFRP